MDLKDIEPPVSETRRRSRNLKPAPVQRSIGQSIGQSLDQALLSLQHSKLGRFTANLKGVPGAAESVDLVSRIGQTVLNRASEIRSQLVTVFTGSGPRETRREGLQDRPQDHFAPARAEKKEGPTQRRRSTTGRKSK